MISLLRGTVYALGTGVAYLDIHGIGFAVLTTPATLSGLRVGSEATLYTKLVVREDSLTLYGFSEEDERDVFTVLQGVSGVGPKLALAILAVHTPDSLRSAVANQDTAALQRVPGIGKKGAQRLVLELGTKLGAPAVHAQHSGGGSVQSNVIEALIGLGWAESEAYEAFEEAQAAHPDGNVATLLRASLQTMGNRR